jgi:hypothetical protein
MVIKISYNFLLFASPSKCYTLCNGFKLMVFDGLSNDNEIA